MAECRVPLIVGKNDMQGYGSAVTYARRYGLMGMAGVAPEDDDGNAAAKAAPKAEDAPRPKPAPKDEPATVTDTTVAWAIKRANTASNRDELTVRWKEIAPALLDVPAVRDAFVNRAKDFNPEQPVAAE
jgi:hypothetical protein